MGNSAAIRLLLDYRLARLGPARALAAATGWAGARFPWESALSGEEVCPAPVVRNNQIHIRDRAYNMDFNYLFTAFLKLDIKN